MTGIRTRVAVCLMTSLLSACALFHASPRAELNLRVPQQDAGTDYAAKQMALGRQMLDDGQFGQAVIAFRNVQHVPEYSAPAHNGLGVAYAQIGRPDLAERYFRMAVLDIPTDARYQANLSRVYASMQRLAAKVERDRQLASAPTVSPNRTVTRMAGQSVVRIELPATRMMKVSSSEVHIASNAPVDARRRSARTALADASKRTRGSAYPIRITFEDRSR